MDIVSKTSQVIKAAEVRKDYDQLLAAKQRGVEKQAGKVDTKAKKSAPTKPSKSGKCCSCLWTTVSVPFIGIKYIFKCTCLRNLSRKKANAIKSVAGFIVGLIIGWIYYWFLDSILESPRRFTIISSVVVLVILSFGLAFSDYVRLMTLISIPTICSSSGRAILIMIIFVEVFRGPVINITYNMNQIGSSIACGQDVVKGDSNKTLSEVLSEKSKQIFNRVMEPIKKYNQQVALTLTTMATASASMVTKIKKIKAIYDKFNLKCKKIAKKIKISCEKIGQKSWWKGSICWIMDKFGMIDSYNNNIHFERFCSPYLLAGRILGKYLVTSALVPTLLKLKEDVEFDIEPNYNYTYSFNQSISSKEVLIRVKNDLKPLFVWTTILVSIITFLAPLASLFILIRSHFYRSKYLSIDHYDNIYTTSYVYDIDRRRAVTNEKFSVGKKSHRNKTIGKIPSLENQSSGKSRQESGLETIFPLSKAEKKRFIEPTDLAWSTFEARRLFVALIFFLFTLFIVIAYILLDYLLYWALDLIARLKDNLDIDVASHESDDASFKINVQGEGDLANVYQNINEVTGEAKDNSTGTVDKLWTCWPEASAPDYDTYRLIRTLLIICLITIIIEAYTLRLRHVFCDYYYPDRAKIRAIWLYNQIIQSRSSFMRSIYSYFHSDKTKQNMNGVTLMDRITICCPCIRWIKDITGHQNLYCANCGRRGVSELKGNIDKEKREDSDNFKRCESTPNCVGIFCTKCLIAIENVCTICNNPVTYVDYYDGDQSEEVDSSDEDGDLDTDYFRSNSNVDFDDILMRNKMQKMAREFIRFEDTKKNKYKTINGKYQLLNQSDEDNYNGVNESSSGKSKKRNRN